MCRMWLSLGIFVIPNSVLAFERPRRSSSAFWCARNDGLCMKKRENADKPMSAIV